MWLVDLGEARERLEREMAWMDARGGQEWIQAYIKPFYMTMQGSGRYDAEADNLVPELRARAIELSLADISDMVTMQWRLQAAGAWFAIARSDSSLSDAVHRGFEHCYGTLTAPSLTVAVLTYPNETTRGVLTTYKERDIANQYGAAGVVDAALRRLDSASDGTSRTRDDDYLDELLKRSARVQTG